MTSPRTLTLSDAAEVCGTTKKALERRAERGTLAVSRRAGVRVVEVPELMRVGLLAADAEVRRPGAPGAADRPLAILARRAAEADADMQDLRATLASTEAALHRAREDARILRMHLAALTAVPGPDVFAETA
jgi:site-specific recombinase XerC